MSGGFTTIDWVIVGGYFALLAMLGWVLNRQKAENARDYFLGGNQMSFWVVAVSVLATSQSAATFLGGPDQGYRGDYTYVATNIGAILAALFVAKFLVPRFYAMRASTVYELLNERYGVVAMKSAGGMYLAGRLLASGSRLYMAAIAVAMILYGNIQADSIISAAFIMMMIGFLVTFMGGIRSVLWSDLAQFAIYLLAAVMVLYFLWNEIPASGAQILDGLGNAPGGQDKLQFFNFDFDFSAPFAMISIVTGLVLLNIGNFGLDQDTSQRLLTCKDANEGTRALYLSVIVAIPVVWLFVSIGQLLHVFYDRPELMGNGLGANVTGEFSGERITIFMHYILNEMPAGLRGLVTVGVVAAAVSTINSGLNSMSSVIVQDFYRPWKEARESVAEAHFVRAGQISMGLVGLGLFATAVLCFFWQRYTDMALLDFALSVMVFAYSGLLGVYFTVVFTKRGTTTSVVAALVIGFLVTLLQQSYIVDSLGLPDSWKSLAFSWQLCIGTLIAFLVCASTTEDEEVSA
ncbi:MAG: sodium:solute symporter [Kordiimonadaceae bacterium]|nr:sodium:solute symporter [Kordiimonadaceae bacterium]MBO6569770.1 sodium:solute symporter [Kordiimonadaceae bacterium]MBO6966305.1 sodium:solute symporter [Kordiimonadaceae bacterium]